MHILRGAVWQHGMGIWFHAGGETLHIFCKWEIADHWKMVKNIHIKSYGSNLPLTSVWYQAVLRNFSIYRSKNYLKYGAKTRLIFLLIVDKFWNESLSCGLYVNGVPMVRKPRVQEMLCKRLYPLVYYHNVGVHVSKLRLIVSYS